MLLLKNVLGSCFCSPLWIFVFFFPPDKLRMCVMCCALMCLNVFSLFRSVYVCRYKGELIQMTQCILSSLIKQLIKVMQCCFFTEYSLF